MRLMKKLVWIGAVIGVIGGAISLVKLVSLVLKVGLLGIPAEIVSAYSSWIAEAQKYLVEIPFHIRPPDWAKHVAVVYMVFVGTNWRFLTVNGHGENLVTGIGDVGRGTRRGSLSKPALIACYVALSLTGPLFTVLVFLLWLGNRQPGPAGVGRWGDYLMIGNRVYTTRISRIYLLILLAQPVIAAALLLWNSLS